MGPRAPFPPPMSQSPLSVDLGDLREADLDIARLRIAADEQLRLPHLARPALRSRLLQHNQSTIRRHGFTRRTTQPSLQEARTRQAAVGHVTKTTQAGFWARASHRRTRVVRMTNALRRELKLPWSAGGGPRSRGSGRRRRAPASEASRGEELVGGARVHVPNIAWCNCFARHGHCKSRS